MYLAFGWSIGFGVDAKSESDFRFDPPPPPNSVSEDPKMPTSTCPDPSARPQAAEVNVFRRSFRGKRQQQQPNPLEICVPRFVVASENLKNDCHLNKKSNKM